MKKHRNMKSQRRQSIHRIQRRGKEWLRRAFIVVIVVLAALTTTTVHADDEIVVTVDRFLLRLGPKQDDFSLQKKVTVLWTIENLVREYFENLYAGSSETIFIGAGITGLSVVPPEEESQSYETVKFLGGAVTFDAASTTTPNQGQLQSYIQEALQPQVVVDRLAMYFPTLNSAVFVPLSLGNRGFGNEVPEEEEEEEEEQDETYEKPKPLVNEDNSAAGENVNIANSDADSDPGTQANGIESSTTLDSSNSTKTTVGLSTGVALGGAIIVLLIALLVQSRQRRMDLWRENRREENSVLSLEEDNTKKEKPSASNSNRYYMEDEQETSLRLPRIWGVTPSRRMSGTTPGSSDVSASNEGDSIQEILTCTSMDRRSIQNVESFEHQKRLVDTLKKEMMASNAEMHPYMQDTHLDNTEPCALSPTDLSAAALENTTPSRPVPTWHCASDSSFTGSGSGSGYDSPTSPLRVMMRTLQCSGTRQQKPPSGRRTRSPYEPDNVEL